MRFSSSAVILLVPVVLGASVHRNSRRACVVNGTSGTGIAPADVSDSVTLTASVTVLEVAPSVNPEATNPITLSLSASIVAQPTPSLGNGTVYAPSNETVYAPSTTNGTIYAPIVPGTNWSSGVPGTKRGFLASNDEQKELVKAFNNSPKIKWVTDYYYAPPADLSPDIEWVAQTYNVPDADKAQKALENGAKRIFSFGEIASAPSGSVDHLDPAQAAALWYEYVSTRRHSSCRSIARCWLC